MAWHLFMNILHTWSVRHESPCSHKGLKIYVQTIQCVSPVNITTLCSTRSVIRIHWVYHLSLPAPTYPPWRVTFVGSGSFSDLTRLCAEIRLFDKSRLVPWMLPRQQLGSCFPGVWMCVAPPSCLNRSLLGELARLPTNPLIPLQWGKSIQTSPANSQVYLNISQPRGWERNNTSKAKVIISISIHKLSETVNPSICMAYLITTSFFFYYFYARRFSHSRLNARPRRLPLNGGSD